MLVCLSVWLSMSGSVHDVAGSRREHARCRSRGEGFVFDERVVVVYVM